MKYENTKSLTELIDKIVLSESKELEKRMQSLLESNTKLRNDIINKNETISKQKDRIEVLSRNQYIIEKYEQDTGKYYKVEPQYEDFSGQGDIGICGIDVIEVTKEQKYPEPTPKQTEQEIESEEIPF